MGNKQERREQRIKQIGLPRQLKAEANLDRQLKDSFTDVVETKTGKKRQMKKRVADIMKLKGEVQSPKLTFSVPQLPDNFDWSK